AVAHHEVDLALPTPPVALHESIPAGQQVLLRQPLAAPAQVVFRRHVHEPGRVADAVDTKHPEPGISHRIPAWGREEQTGRMTARIRPARPEDAPRIVDIWATGWRDGHLADAPPELLAHRDHDAFVPRVDAAIARTWVAETGGEIAGFTMVHDDEVDQLYVDTPFRGTGIAS